MALRSVLVALVLGATAMFVAGVAIERSSGEGDHHEASATAPAAGRENSESSEGAGSETAQAHTSEGESGEAGAAGGEEHAELRPLGIDVEAWPFVALAALTSVGLAAAAWLHPRSTPLLVLVALAMVLFTVLDVREVFHQADIDKNGLAVLAGVVAALHAAAAAVAGTMASRGRHPTPAAPGSPGTMPT
jgi:hypothetical protein